MDQKDFREIKGHEIVVVDILLDSMSQDYGEDKILFCVIILRETEQEGLRRIRIDFFLYYLEELTNDPTKVSKVGSRTSGTPCRVCDENLFLSFTNAWQIQILVFWNIENKDKKDFKPITK